MGLFGGIYNLSAIEILKTYSALIVVALFVFAILCVVATNQAVDRANSNNRQRKHYSKTRRRLFLAGVYTALPQRWQLLIFLIYYHYCFCCCCCFCLEFITCRCWCMTCLYIYIYIAYILQVSRYTFVYRLNQPQHRVCILSQLMTALFPSIPLFWFLSQREYANYGQHEARRILRWPAGSKQLLGQMVPPAAPVLRKCPNKSGCAVMVNLVTQWT